MDFSQLDPEKYNEQLAQKVNEIKNKFQSFSPPELKVYPSSDKHYRARTEFRVWHDGEDLYFYMFDQALKQNIRCDQFLPASELINAMMIDLMKALKPNKILRHKLFQVDFLSTKSGEILVSLLYHRQLDDEWTNEIHKLKNNLSKKYKVHFVGRARQQKIIMDQDFVIEKISVNGKELVYKQVENSFTQPNTDVAIKMLEWAIEHTQNAKGDLLELYCGNGNFSIALAQNFQKVLATEISKTSVDSAQYNIKENKISNLNIIRMSAEEFTSAMNGEREFTRLRGIDLKSYQCETILVDPPRMGLDAQSVQMVANYNRIVYISCNPDTLLENLMELTKTHQISHFALFDQFPYTHHIECGVILDLKK